jgi:hypothetical protein
MQWDLTVKWRSRSAGCSWLCTYCIPEPDSGWTLRFCFGLRQLYRIDSQRNKKVVPWLSGKSTRVKGRGIKRSSLICPLIVEVSLRGYDNLLHLPKYTNALAPTFNI